MQIGFNLLYVLPDMPGGTETYARTLIRTLVAVAPGHSYVAFVSRVCGDLADELRDSKVEVVRCPLDSRRRLERYCWEQLLLPGYVNRRRIDVLHSLGYVAPVHMSTGNVVTIPDLNFIALRESMSIHRRLVLGLFVRTAARIADHVITISEFSRGQIIEQLRVAAERVTSIHLGPSEVSAKPDETAYLRHGLRQPYILAFAGTGSPHKNIARLVGAFAASGAGRTHQLVLVGRPPQELLATSHLVEERQIRIVEFLPRAELLGLVTQAALFVMPSLYEGFGLPVLEAQAAGVPVICSRAGSLGEVAGSGALLFDPTSELEIASAIAQTLSDVPFRQSLAAAGRANVARFSWRHAAHRTLEVYEQVMQSRQYCSSAGPVR